MSLSVPSKAYKPKRSGELGMLSHSVMSNSATPWITALQAPLSMEFSRQEYWSGLPFPTLRDLPNPRIKPVSLVSSALAGRFFTTVPPGKSPPHPKKLFYLCYSHW